MHEYLSGEVVQILADGVTIDVGGIGYRLRCPSTSLGKLRAGSEARLFCSHRLREEQFFLYGFTSLEERDLFERLCRVSGVGPAIAIAIISGVPMEDFRKAVLDGQSKVLEGIKGVGRKTAQRLIIDLRGALEEEDLVPAAGLADSGRSPQANDAIRALEVLGFSTHEAQQRVAKVISQDPGEISSADLVRLASRGN